MPCNLQILQVNNMINYIMGKLESRVASRFAETMLYWRGHLRAKEVQDFLGVSERTARSLISKWRRLDTILPCYRPNAKRRLVPMEEFDPSHEIADPNVTLSLLLIADRFCGNPFSLVPPLNGGHDLAMSAPIPSKASREVIAACLDRLPVEIFYVAKTGHQEFVFHPSALIRSRGRYHLRGYRTEGRNATGLPLDNRYVDVVPARTIESQRVEHVPFVGLEGDIDWHTFEERKFFLSNDLSEEERLCYEHEYGIADSGELKIRNRRALMPYVLQELSERQCWRRDGTSVPVWAIG